MSEMGQLVVFRRRSSGLLRSRPIWPSTAGMYAAIYTRSAVHWCAGWS